MTAAAKPSREREAVHFGQHNIDNEQIVRIRFRMFEAFFAIGGQVNGIPLFAQAFLNELPKILIVLNNKNPQRATFNGQNSSCDDLKSAFPCDSFYSIAN